MGLFKKIKEAWLASMSFDNLDDAFYEELEEALILADVGVETASDAVHQLRKRVYQKLLTRADEVKEALRDILAEKLDVGETALNLSTQPSVILVIGVNGVGKTTTIGKLAKRFKAEGKKVLLCRGRYVPRRRGRPARRSGRSARACRHRRASGEGADPGAVVFDALQAAKARGSGRASSATRPAACTTRQNLMNELAKIRRDHRPRGAGRREGDAPRPRRDDGAERPHSGAVPSRRRRG